MPRFAAIDLTPDIDRLPRQPGHQVLAAREREASITLHYGAVTQVDRSQSAEIATLLSYARHHLAKNWETRRGRAPIYGDGPMYELAVLSNGTRVTLRAHPQQLWHCGNGAGNATSVPVVVPLGRNQELSPAQRESLLSLFDDLCVSRGIPPHAVYGHHEWPRTTGAPAPATTYRLLAGQSECPGPVLHRHLVAYRAGGAPYTAQSRILGPSRATLAQATRYVLARPNGAYTDEDLAEVILPAYWRQCAELGIVFEIAVAQAIHETACFSSWWSQRPRRNPAGIAVTGRTHGAPIDQPPGVNWAWDPALVAWREGASFTAWVDTAIPAQLGRLLAYALPVDAPTTLAQEAAIRHALSVRPLDRRARGSAPILDALGAADNPVNAGLTRERWIAGWAWDGEQYGEALARTANAIRSQLV